MLDPPLRKEMLLRSHYGKYLFIELLKLYCQQIPAKGKKTVIPLDFLYKQVSVTLGVRSPGSFPSTRKTQHKLPMGLGMTKLKYLHAKNVLSFSLFGIV